MMETLFCNLLSKFKQLKGGSVPDAGAGGSLAGRPLAISRFDATSRVARVFCGIVHSIIVYYSILYYSMVWYGMV